MRKRIGLEKKKQSRVSHLDPRVDTEPSPACHATGSVAIHGRSTIGWVKPVYLKASLRVIVSNVTPQHLISGSD